MFSFIYSLLAISKESSLIDLKNLSLLVLLFSSCLITMVFKCLFLLVKSIFPSLSFLFVSINSSNNLSSFNFKYVSYSYK